jgi:hypothetical protein
MPGTDHVKKVGGSRKSLASARSPLPWLPRSAMESIFVRTQPSGLDWSCSKAAFDGWQGASRRDLKAGQSIFAMVAHRWIYGCHSIRAAARYETALARAYHGTSADQGRCCRAGQQNRTYGVGHDGTRRTLQGAEIALGSSIAKSRSRASMNWRGHDDVMQIRSIRGSGEPAWVIALPSAGKRLGPDPRRALGPAAIRAASTGRTRDRTRPMLQNRQKVLAKGAVHT